MLASSRFSPAVFPDPVEQATSISIASTATDGRVRYFRCRILLSPLRVIEALHQCAARRVPVPRRRGRVREGAGNVIPPWLLSTPMPRGRQANVPVGGEKGSSVGSLDPAPASISPTLADTRWWHMGLAPRLR